MWRRIRRKKEERKEKKMKRKYLYSPRNVYNNIYVKKKIEEYGERKEGKERRRNDRNGDYI